MIAKYRGKRTDTGEWVYGYYGYKEASDQHFIMVETLHEDSRLGSYFTDHEVDPNTVGQYSGLQDKNGKEICDGDIGYVLIGRYHEPKKPLLVEVQQDRCFWSWFEGERDTPHEIWPNDQFEVLGNRHDHPHLLEGTR